MILATVGSCKDEQCASWDLLIGEIQEFDRKVMDLRFPVVNEKC
jgi:hypothetical protein